MPAPGFTTNPVLVLRVERTAGFTTFETRIAMVELARNLNLAYVKCTFNNTECTAYQNGRGIEWPVGTQDPITHWTYEEMQQKLKDYKEGRV